MIILVKLFVVCFLSVAAAFHFYWGLGGRRGWQVAIPQRADNSPLFEPSPGATLVVGILLAGMAAAVTVFSWRVVTSMPLNYQRSGIAVLGLIFLARAFVPHPSVGFFKSIRNTQFSRYDTLFYSPTCLLAGLGLILIAWIG
ncbi:MAG: DUF3995 domain-containing protein [Proteobacteria bacterium]|nr:DUF3995 domain-containing protein [Pseudomonadota bacterium]